MGAVMNPHARQGRHHIPACSAGGLRGKPCGCPFLVSCSDCGGVAFCYCNARMEDIARELAEEQARRETEDAWRAWQVFTADDCDEAMERDRAHGYEQRQARADADRWGNR